MSNIDRQTAFKSKDTHVHVLNVHTNLPGGGYSITIRRNNPYTPYKYHSNQKRQNKTTETNDVNDNVSIVQEQNTCSVDEWQTISSKKKEKPIYYWVVDNHNLFNKKDRSYRLFFTEPDSTQIENMDQTNYMAIDEKGQLRLLHSQLKHNGMKMNPTFFIARGIKQIEEALRHVKYCVVKVENNEQKLIEDPKILKSKTF